MKVDQALKHCLAYEVLNNIEEWLGYPSTHNLAAFLGGVEFRIRESGITIPEWKVFGPLCQKEFYQPLLENTGHPTLSIRWSTALEIVNFKNSDSINELIKLIDAWHSTKGIESIKLNYPPEKHDPQGIKYHLGRLAKRPGMYTGDNEGWSFYCFLTGMLKGGDWLGIPPSKELEMIYKLISSKSLEAYGSEWAAFRFNSPKSILSWANIEPID